MLTTFPVVPIQTRYPPDNVLFEMADVKERLNFEDASVDVVHARMTCLSVRHFIASSLHHDMEVISRRTPYLAFCARSRGSCAPVGYSSARNGILAQLCILSIRGSWTLRTTCPKLSRFTI